MTGKFIVLLPQKNKLHIYRRELADLTADDFYKIVPVVEDIELQRKLLKKGAKDTFSITNADSVIDKFLKDNPPNCFTPVKISKRECNKFIATSLYFKYFLYDILEGNFLY